MAAQQPAQVVIHAWKGDLCSCGSDTVVCQGCGQIVCGALAVWRDAPGPGHGNVGPCCFSRFGMGHQGTVRRL